MKPRVFIICGALALLAACSPLSVINAISPAEGVEVFADQAYGTQERQKLDIYRPQGVRQNAPTVLFLYGGSWERGQREKYAFVGNALALKGFVVAVADYRTYPDVQFPAFVEDAAHAVRWLSENAEKHGGTNNSLHLMGHSAGAHIVAMLALNPAYLEGAGVSRNVLGRWVGLAGPYAFTPSETRSVRDIFANVTDDAARPIVFADEKAPAALLLHGGDDSTVYPENSQQLADALTKSGAKAQAHIYDDIGHVSLILSLTPPFQGLSGALQDSAQFLKSGTLPKR